MRPNVLFPLLARISSLPHVGPKIADTFKRLDIETVFDLLCHVPTSIIDRRIMPPSTHAESGSIASFHVTIDYHEPQNRKPYKILCKDKFGSISLIFFNGRADYLQKQYPEGSERVISGTVTRYNNIVQMAHPDISVPVSEKENVLRLDPVYGACAWLSQKVIKKAINSALGKVPHLPEWIRPEQREKEHWLSWNDALNKMHKPIELKDNSDIDNFRRRLAYDELLANQISLSITRRQRRKKLGRQFPLNPQSRQNILSHLPFTLMPAQQTALDEIDHDMHAPQVMTRLLQGDVGSGKTIIAFLAMVAATDTGAQAALLAPTDILAHQHFNTLQPYAQKIGLNMEILSGRNKGRVRTSKLMALMENKIHILIGTHALFQEDVTYHDLGLIVVDEQHRFGVHQRLSLSAKGKTPDVLVMTATPIPRTLTLTVYGDMDVSQLKDKPPGRQPIDTRVMPSSKIPELEDGIAREIERNGQIFWVCPRVVEEEESPLISVEERYAHLEKRFPNAVAFIHGKMSGTEKDATMEKFSSGEVSILVATSVIEVGVHVPNASIMIIENSTQFGLAQLHQLRGRIGRGTKKATCILLYQPPLGKISRQRLETLKHSNDGFYIAEQDLKLRGAGEVLGTRQSGLPKFRLADIAKDRDLMIQAWEDAQTLLKTDPDLTSPRGGSIHTLLHLFNSDKALQLLNSG